jgi:hypothetical protein
MDAEDPGIGIEPAGVVQELVTEDADAEPAREAHPPGQRSQHSRAYPSMS